MSRKRNKSSLTEVFKKLFNTEKSFPISLLQTWKKKGIVLKVDDCDFIQHLTTTRFEIDLLKINRKELEKKLYIPERIASKICHKNRNKKSLTTVFKNLFTTEKSFPRSILQTWKKQGFVLKVNGCDFVDYLLKGEFDLLDHNIDLLTTTYSVLQDMLKCSQRVGKRICHKNRTKKSLIECFIDLFETTAYWSPKILKTWARKGIHLKIEEFDLIHYFLTERLLRDEKSLRAHQKKHKKYNNNPKGSDRTKNYKNKPVNEEHLSNNLQDWLQDRQDWVDDRYLSFNKADLFKKLKSRQQKNYKQVCKRKKEKKGKKIARFLE